jgi:hypothetical protein
MKKQLALLACTLLSRMLFSQAVPMALEEWRTNSGTQDFYFKNLTKTDPSGNVIVAGTAMNGGTTDILVAKYNSSGNQLWIQQFAGAAPGGVDFSGGLFVTDTYVYITGAITNNTLVPETDCVTMKLASSTGSVVWSSTYDGAGNFHDMGKHVTVDGSGNVFVSGASYNASMNTDILCLRYNSSGVQQWASTWDYLGFDDASIKVATSGANLNITGAVTTATAGAYKLATLSLSQSTGSLLATNVSTAVTTTSVDVVTDFTSDGSGNIIIVGSNTVGGEGNNFYVQKMSNTLVTAWTYTWNGSSSLDDVAKAIEVDASNNVYIAGYSTSSTLGKELTIIKLNSSGTQQWVQTSGFNGNDEASDLILDAGGDVYVGGYKTDSTQNYYTTKYDGSGTKIWETELTGLLNDYATNITLDSLNNVVVTGQSEITTGIYNFTTVKYAQHDVITPTDFNGETPSANFMYYTNRGQLVDTNQAAVPYIKYYTHNTYPSFYFKNRSQSFVFARIDTVVATADTLHRIDLDFTNSIESSETYAMDEQENGYLNYFLAHTDSNGVTGVKGNQRLVTPNLYNNIDLMCSSNQNGIKYYFIVKPGGDMRDIKMEFTGATSYSLDGTTNELSINSSIGSFSFDRPTVYQLTTGNATVAVSGWTPDWTVDGASNKYKFNDGAYTSSLTLVIEVDQGNGTTSIPSSIDNLTWSTYYGGSDGEDMGYSIKNDNTGNIYVGGYSSNPNFPATTGAYQTNFSAGDIANAVLMKFDISRVRQWSTYYGGDNEDVIMSISFDHLSDQMYVAGYTASANFPVIIKTGTTTSPSYQGLTDGFIASFNIVTGYPTWTNLIGTPGYDRSSSIYLDNGKKYLVGHACSTMVVLNTASFYMQGSYGGGDNDGFIAKFNSSDQKEWLTYYGGNDNDYAKSVTTDINGNIIVWGETSSTTFNTYDPDPTGHTAIYIDSNSGQSDFFILKFNSSGSRLWATLYGGDQTEWAADADGVITIGSDIYCVGTTFSANMPIQQFGSTPTYAQNGTQDCYIVCFNSSYQKKWATYFGGSDTDWAGGITKDNHNNIFVTGVTNSSDYLSVNQTGFYSSGFYGMFGIPGPLTGDAFLTAFANNSFAPVWSTFIGGNYSDIGTSISIFNNKLFITGETTSHIDPFVGNDLYPVVDPGSSAYQYSPLGSTGGSDIFISEFNINNMSTQVGVKEYKESNLDVSVYPNPFASEIKIKGLNDKSAYTIYDLTGKQMFSDKIKSEENFVNLSILSSGVYLLKLNNENGNYKTYKIIKN